MSPEKNPVVHAFKNVGGKGLAGVITQFSLDYEGSTWGSSVDKHLRAPKHIKINMSFQPIHDMPLGIDHQGSIVSPTHPVGPYTAKRVDEAHDDLYSAIENQKKVAQDKWVVVAAEAKKNRPQMTTQEKKDFGRTKAKGMELPF